MLEPELNHAAVSDLLLRTSCRRLLQRAITDYNFSVEREYLPEVEVIEAEVRRSKMRRVLSVERVAVASGWCGKGRARWTREGGA